MAGHIQDRWYKNEKQPDGTTKRVRTGRHGTGLRYRARYIDPDGKETSESFPDREKRRAEKWLDKMRADMESGQYTAPVAAKKTFRAYVEQFMEAGDESVQSQLRLHAIPHLGSRQLGAFRPEHIRAWLGELERKNLASSYQRVIFGSVSAVLGAAVEDGYLAKNPCSAKSVKKPAPGTGRVEPWPISTVIAVREGLRPEFQAMVDIGGNCGLRQGEIFGLAMEAVDFDDGWLRVNCQVKVVRGRLVFDLPKRDKVRDVPLPHRTSRAIREHLRAFPPVPIELPWKSPSGRPVTKRLLFTRLDGRGAVRRTDFNAREWKVALERAGVIPPGENGRHAAAREHGMHALRHFYASVLLHGGTSIKALSRYLGHTDPGFTLRTYTHLMPDSDRRARQSVDEAFDAVL